MEHNNRYLNEKLIDEVLTSEPTYSLSDKFSENLVRKVARKYAFQQYLKEFVIYLVTFAGIALVAISINLYFASNLNLWIDFVRSNIYVISCVLFLLIFILFTDRVLLRYYLNHPYSSDF